MKVSRIPIPPLSHSSFQFHWEYRHSATQHDLTHLETVSLVHQKPLPLGGEMHLFCVLWSHTRERTLKYSPLLQTLTLIPPNMHKRWSYLRHQWVEVCIVLLCYGICAKTHTYNYSESLSSHCKSMHSWQSLHSNKKGLGTYQTLDTHKAYNYVGRHSNKCLWENEVFPRPFFNPVPRQEWHGNEVWYRSGMGVRFGTL